MIWGIKPAATSGLLLSTVLWPQLWGEKRKQLLDVQKCNSGSILTIKLNLPVRPFLPKIHCVILLCSHQLQIKVLNSTSNLQRYSSSLSSSPSLLLRLTHNSIHVSLYASVWKVIPIVPCSTFMLQLLPLSLFSLISHPCCHDEGKEANCQTRLREELPSLVLPFNSWYNREEEEEEQRRGVKHERDEERFDRLPRSVTPRGTCPGYVSRWQALLCSCVCWCVCVCACSNSCGRPESSQLSVTGLQPRQLEGTILSLPTDLFLTLNVKLGLKRHLNNQISVKICTCKKQIALITIKRPSRLRSQPVLPRCKANSTLSVLKWRLHWCLHKSLTVKLNFTLLIHPPLSCISFMSRQSTAISICQLKMCVNEECVGALMMKLSPPAILNLGLNLRSVLYLLIKVVPKLG